MRHAVPWPVLVSLLGVCLSTTTAVAQETPAIRVTNHKTDSTVRYPVVLLRGDVANSPADSITVVNRSSKRPSRQLSGQVHNGKFKVLCELMPGANDLYLTAGTAEAAFQLRYQPQSNPYFVRIIYMTDSTGKTTYETPFANDAQDYANRLDTAMKLMQTMTAERMNDLGFGRITFNLELDENGKVRVHTFKGRYPAAHYWGLREQTWFDEVATEMETPFPTAKARNIVIAAYTRFDPKTKKFLAHTALGLDGLGLFGGACLFTWPSKLADVQKAFVDERRIDPDRFYTSTFRGADSDRMWGTASTTIGCTLHEMGHTFGLQHSTDPQDIMTRGFDRFNRVFTVTEPGPGGRPREYADSEVACFPAVSARCLRLSPWFALDPRPAPRPEATMIRFDAAQGLLVASSPLGIGYLGASQDGDMRYYTAPPLEQKAPAKLTASLADVKKRVTADDFKIYAIDAAGRWQTTRFSRLPLSLAGVWAGKWGNSRAEKGNDLLDLTEDYKDNLQGTWGGNLAVKGERIGKEGFFFRAQTTGRSYRAAGWTDGRQLFLDYATEDDKGKYLGWATLQQAGTVAQVVRPPKARFADRWTGKYTNSNGAAGDDALQLAEESGQLKGNWSDIPVTGERTGNTTFHLEGTSGDRAYRLMGRIERDRLLLDYSARQGSELYYGRSIMTR